ncbi:hypothetical protein FOZ61_010782 [Perkinsus olseni]|uniref:ethanolamine kinase n=1 Tax=Perkinsus olseni TaxID=32597 RepID=A0A7J6M235_PEROL|nr:hypothetical protein FOZ61_010782 [Perkinsus olseni]KAF4672331.1 hypothetical protein FOL46_009159 [Perkinsus olseni]
MPCTWEQVPRFEVSIDPSDPRVSDHLESLCRECVLRYNDEATHLAGAEIEGVRARKTPVEVTRVTGGITNSLFKVEFCVGEDSGASPASNAPTDSTAESASGCPDKEGPSGRLPVCLVRVFGEAGSSIIDRKTENRVFNNLSSIGFGPALLGIFRNGRVEEFLTQLRPLGPLEMVTEKWTPAIARHLRYMHSLEPAAARRRRDGNQPDLWDRIRSYVAKGRELLKSSPEDEEDDFMTMLSTVEEEAKWLRSTIESRKSVNESSLEKIVFCHNDLLSGNILVPKDGDGQSSLRFIDYEYCAFNPAVADIANHFAAVVESMLIVENDYNVAKYFPSKDLQLLFLRNYLTEREYSSLDESTMLESVRLYAMAAELRWCAWSVIQHFEQDNSTEDEDDDDASLFDYENYGKARLRGYFGLRMGNES